jgi:uncharacterized membrane protein YedE/YeeE
MPPADRMPKQVSSSLGMALAGLLGQIGCLTVVIVLAALATGLWLDGRLQTKPLFTIGLLLGSVPVSLYLMVRILLAGMARIQGENGAGAPAIEEDAEGGKKA